MIPTCGTLVRSVLKEGPALYFKFIIITGRVLPSSIEICVVIPLVKNVNVSTVCHQELKEFGLTGPRSRKRSIDSAIPTKCLNPTMIGGVHESSVAPLICVIDQGTILDE